MPIGAAPAVARRMTDLVVLDTQILVNHETPSCGTAQPPRQIRVCTHQNSGTLVKSVLTSGTRGGGRPQPPRGA